MAEAMTTSVAKTSPQTDADSHRRQTREDEKVSLGMQGTVIPFKGLPVSPNGD
jgi:hypothetical protein